MQHGLGEVAGGEGLSFLVDDVLEPHPLVRKPSLQRPRVQVELAGDLVGVAVPGRQQPPGQLSDAFREVAVLGG